MNRREVLKASAAFALAGFRSSAADNTVPLQEISSSFGLRAAVFSDGRYQITAAQFGWTFGGTVGHPVQNVSTLDGLDGVGAWHEIAFDYDSARHSAIRIYENKGVVLFSTNHGQDSPNSDPFPRFTSFPQGLSTFSYTTLWNYEFGALGNRSPWLFFDAQANAILLSPASNFMTAFSRIAGDGAIEAGIDPRIASFPAGFSHRTVLTLDHGINAAFETWGRALTDLYGKVRPANDSITLLNKLSYWTDASTAYYYRPSDPTLIAPTLLQVRSTFEKLSLPIGSMELDSWHYPKGSPPAWNQVGSGLATFQADSTVFPAGLSGFQRNLGLPLIAHSRWIDASSSLRKQYQVSGNVSIDPRYWRDYAKYLTDSGVEVLEQDWLSGPAITDFNLTDPDAFLDNMASAMQTAGHSIVYCMPTSAHLLQSSKYNNVVAARVAHDGLQRVNWDDMLINSRLAGAVGLWPFADAYTTAKGKDLLLAALTAGPAGSGEAYAVIDEVNLRQLVRRDGVIVKPDAPIYPVDDSWLARSKDQNAPVVASTYTDHGSVRTAYVFTYTRVTGAISPIAFSPQSLGIAQDAYVYDYFGKTGTVVSAGSQSTHTVDFNASYFIVAPIGPSGIAFLGDAGKFVSNGKKRIEQLSDDGVMRAVVRFAPGETHLQLHLYSEARPHAAADSGHAGSPLALGHGLYRLTVSPDSTGVAVVRFWTAANSQTS